MKILIIASDKGGHFVPFIEEQIAALEACGIEILRYGITGKGALGYLRELPSLKRMIRNQQPDIIHAHYGLSGLLANLQRRVPVVTTYHGSDINVPSILRLSKLAIYLSAYNIFVSKRNIAIAKPNDRYTLLPCGVNLTEDQLLSRNEARKVLGLDMNEQIILFAGAFANAVKNAPLAKAAIEALRQRIAYGVERENSEANNLASRLCLQELRGFSRTEVNTWMCAANCLLMTSKIEGSPQVIKESMVCGCPIVSVDVGDVAERTDGVEGCYVVESREPDAIAEALQKALAFDGKTSGRRKILEQQLSNEQVAQRLMTIYNQVII